MNDIMSSKEQVTLTLKQSTVIDEHTCPLDSRMCFYTGSTV